MNIAHHSNYMIEWADSLLEPAGKLQPEKMFSLQSLI